MVYLKVDKKLCTGCRTCETVCSLAKEHTVNKARSRIRIHRTGVVALKPKVCIQCRKPLCLDACPVGAISQKEGKVRVDASVCTGCGECVGVCDRLFLSPEGDTVLMCDQCGACIPECPEGALSL